ncbi:unnamed protein product [Dimorphilus gyrociliatus]|uniref:Uncharacterized protein n=1 Tax=Dimorphilus gyrociliatus TaxID=2664684 RepID=A0A7I8W4E6_9ANNE|nr:unnamed protein product [Dimorphilus gyrociliatus]
MALSTREALRRCLQTTDINEVISLSKHSDPTVRQRALREMCPCRVKTDIGEFWARVLEMIDDPATNVRQQVLHTLCDGSPVHMEYDVVEALQKFNIDSDKEIRRKAHKALASYSRTGKWNIL